MQRCRNTFVACYSLYSGHAKWDVCKGMHFFDKSGGYARPYPIVDITSHNPELLGWLGKTLSVKDFKVIRLKYSIRLKTVSQVERWFNEIKPSNSTHTRKWSRWKSKYMGP